MFVNVCPIKQIFLEWWFQKINGKFLQSCIPCSPSCLSLQVEKFTTMARERMELGKALIRASDKAANPKAKATPKAKAKVSPAKPIEA